MRWVGLTVAVGLMALLHVAGTMQALNLSHPFWHAKATLIGTGAGLVLTVGLCWLGGVAPGPARMLEVLSLIALPVALAVTWYAARIFINSADYEPFAGKVWFLGYHALVALLVVAVAHFFPRLARR